MAAVRNSKLMISTLKKARLNSHPAPLKKGPSQKVSYRQQELLWKKAKARSGETDGKRSSSTFYLWAENSIIRRIIDLQFRKELQFEKVYEANRLNDNAATFSI